MNYVQTNYSQIQGINGRYTIHDIGCFITAFCNLLARYGRGIDPPALNNALASRGLYIDVDDGIRDDVTWSTITLYDPSIVLTGVGVGVPRSPDAIVKFEYNSFQTGQPATHFSLVDHIDGSNVYILDSWDGQVKNANVYGGVKAWATYQNKIAAKEEPMTRVLNAGDIENHFWHLMKRHASSGDIKTWTGRTFDELFYAILDSPEYKAVQEREDHAPSSDAQAKLNQIKEIVG